MSKGSIREHKDKATLTASFFTIKDKTYWEVIDQPFIFIPLNLTHV